MPDEPGFSHEGDDEEDEDEQDSDDEDDAKDRKTTPRRTQERAAQKREPATRQAAAVGDVEEDRPTEYLLVDYTYIHTYIHQTQPKPNLARQDVSNIPDTLKDILKSQNKAMTLIEKVSEKTPQDTKTDECTGYTRCIINQTRYESIWFI